MLCEKCKKNLVTTRVIENPTDKEMKRELFVCLECARKTMRLWRPDVEDMHRKARELGLPTLKDAEASLLELIDQTLAQGESEAQGWALRAIPLFARDEATASEMAKKAIPFLQAEEPDLRLGAACSLWWLDCELKPLPDFPGA